MAASSMGSPTRFGPLGAGAGTGALGPADEAAGEDQETEKN